MVLGFEGSGGQVRCIPPFTLPKDANIHAREYQLYLPSKEQLQRKLMEWVGEQLPHTG